MFQAEENTIILFFFVLGTNQNNSVWFVNSGQETEVDFCGCVHPVKKQKKGTTQPGRVFYSVLSEAG